MKFVLITILLAAAIAVNAQSGRTSPNNALETPPALRDLTVKQMYDEVMAFVRAKAAEYEAKKIPFSEKLFERTQLEQRQLAARYATLATGRKELSAEDHYFAGLLHWIAANLDGAAAELSKYVVSADAIDDKRQTARSVLAVVAAKQGRVKDAESHLADYLGAEPKKLTERARIESELAKAYQARGDFERMVPHAVENFKSARALLDSTASRLRALDEILDAGMLVFEAYSGSGKQKDADASLVEMRTVAANLLPASFYYYAADQQIKYMIETGRKAEALKFFAEMPALIDREIASKPYQDELKARFKKRGRHYALLGEPAPEFLQIDQWFPGKQDLLSSYKGKVVLLDFWATWCMPCLEAFPELIAWRTEFAGQGFEILGVTRYYGTINGVTADEPSELAFFKSFTKKQGISYDIAVGKTIDTQLLYGATSLPTAVIIDRKGVIRYIEAGTNTQRLAQMRQTIVKLLAEK